MWTSEFENDSTLGIMGDCFANLQSKSAPQILSHPMILLTLFSLFQTINLKPHKNHHPQPLMTKFDAKRKRSSNASSRCPCKTKAVGMYGLDTLLPSRTAQADQAPRRASVATLPPPLRLRHTTPRLLNPQALHNLPIPNLSIRLATPLFVRHLQRIAPRYTPLLLPVQVLEAARLRTACRPCLARGTSSRVCEHCILLSPQSLVN